MSEPMILDEDELRELITQEMNNHKKDMGVLCAEPAFIEHAAYVIKELSWDSVNEVLMREAGLYLHVSTDAQQANIVLSKGKLEDDDYHFLEAIDTMEYLLEDEGPEEWIYYASGFGINIDPVVYNGEEKWKVELQSN